MGARETKSVGTVKFFFTVVLHVATNNASVIVDLSRPSVVSATVSLHVFKTRENTPIRPYTELTLQSEYV